MQLEGNLHPRWACAGLGASLILALALRLWAADYSPWFDEWMSRWFADRPLSDLWSTWMVRETNPPLYYTLLKGWTGLFGSQVFAMRALSVLGGMASVGLLAACAHQVAGRRAALIAALLAALSAQHVFYGTQIRGYIYAELGFAISLLGLLLLFRSDRTKPQQFAAAALYALGAAAAIYCHTTMILWPIAATATALGLTVSRQVSPRQLVLVLAASVAVAAIAAWWLYITALQLNSGAKPVSWIPAVSLTGYLSMLRQSLFLIWNNTGAFKAASYLLVVLSLGAVLGRNRQGASLLLALLLSSATVFFVAGLFKPIILGRTLFWMSGLVVVLLSASLASLRPAWLGSLALAAICGLLAADLRQARSGFESEDWQGYMRFQASDPAATVLVIGPANGIVARQACETELAAPCPLRFAAIAPAGQAAGSGEMGDKANVILQAGAHPPLSGQVYLLDTAGGSAASLFALPAGVPMRTFAGLTLRGPVAAEQVVAR